jgi:hypothetical protein
MQSTKVINLCLKRVICNRAYLGTYLKVSLFKRTPRYTASAIIQKDIKKLRYYEGAQSKNRKMVSIGA